MQGKAGQKSEQRTQSSIQPEKGMPLHLFFQALSQRRIKGEKKEPKKMQGKAVQKSEQRTQTSIRPEKRHTPSPFFQALNQRRIKGEKKEPKKMQGAIEAGQRSIGSAQKSKSKKKTKKPNP